MTIHRSSMRHAAIQIGGYQAGGSVVPGPALRDPATGVAKVFDGSEQNEHFTVTSTPYAYTVTHPQPGLRKVSFGPQVPGADLTYFLPFRADNISSVVLGGGADLFITDNLSGCSIFIDRSATGDIIVYHANKQGMSLAPSAEQRQDASFEKEGTVALKKSQHSLAKNATYAGATPLTSLFKKRYMTDAARAENVSRFVGQGNTTVYGTTVVGFRRGGIWLFWYQTWSCSAAGLAYRVIKAEQFYP